MFDAKEPCDARLMKYGGDSDSALHGRQVSHLYLTQSVQEAYSGVNAKPISPELTIVKSCDSLVMAAKT